MSLLLELLFGLSGVVWRGWEGLSMIASSFASILSSTLFSREGKLRADKRFSLLDEFVQSVCVLFLDVCTPGHRSKEDCAGHSRLTEHLQHPVADTEVKEVKPTPVFLINGLCICGPVQIIV